MKEFSFINFKLSLALLNLQAYNRFKANIDDKVVLELQRSSGRKESEGNKFSLQAWTNIRRMKINNFFLTENFPFKIFRQFFLVIIHNHNKCFTRQLNLLSFIIARNLFFPHDTFLNHCTSLRRNCFIKNSWKTFSWWLVTSCGQSLSFGKRFLIRNHQVQSSVKF